MFSKRGANSTGGPVRLKVPFQPSTPPTSPLTPPEAVPQEPLSQHSSLFEFDAAEILTNPSAAEDAIHGALTLRALRWLDLLEKDERDSTGKPIYDLELQVSMFRVISDWLKTSKRTKGQDDDQSIPGIDQMRQIISDELDARKAAEKAKKASEPDSRQKQKAVYATRKPGPVSAADDSKLDALLERARRVDLEEDDDGD